MKIANDIITFDDADIAALSPGLQKALQNYAGTNLDDAGSLAVTAAKFLSDRTNEVLTAAKAVAKRSNLDDLNTLADALVVADDVKQAQVEALLEQARAVLAVTKSVEVAK